jgi:predicted metalloendopeptidase
VEEMMADIRVTFKALVRQAKWMDEETRNHALRKLRAMRQLIGYPDFFVEPSYIEEQYRGVSTICIIFKAFCNKNNNNNLYDVLAIHEFMS